MPRAFIELLLWDDEHEEHLGRHLDPDIVHDMVLGGDWIQVENKREHAEEYVRLIGPDRSGALLTVVLEPTAEEGVWRPVTAWWANEREANLYRRRRRNPYVG